MTYHVEAPGPTMSCIVEITRLDLLQVQPLHVLHAYFQFPACRFVPPSGSILRQIKPPLQAHSALDKTYSFPIQDEPGGEGGVCSGMLLSLEVRHMSRGWGPGEGGGESEPPSLGSVFSNLRQP